MRSHSGTNTGKHMGMFPFIPLSLSMVVFALLVFLLLGSISSLRDENVMLRADLSALRNEVISNQEALKEQNKQADAGGDELQYDIRELKARTDALLAYHGGIEGLKNTPANPNLSVTSFDLKFFNNADYKYQSYTGTGTIGAGDAHASYLALLKKTLKSGGAPTTKKVDYIPILVVNGTGTFYTDDSMEGVVEKPVYEFEIIGYITMTGNESK